MKRAKTLRQILVLTALCLLGVSFVLPLVWMIRSSFMEVGQIFILPPQWVPHPATLANFAEALDMAPFGRYTFNTLEVVVLNTAGVLLTATLAAYGFSRIQWKGRDVVFALVLSSMMLPGAVTLIPQFVGWRSLGFYDTLVPLVMPGFLGGGAFNIFLFRQFFMTIPAELDEAAVMDGASHRVIYARIILPLSRSAMIVVALFCFMANWNDFFNPLIYLNSQEKFTLAIGLQQLQGQYVSQWNIIMAASTLVVVPCVLVFLAGQKYILEGIVMTGLKG